MDALSRVTRTEYVTAYRGYHLLLDWYPGPTRRLVCAGLRAASARPYDPDDVRDGEAPHFDTEADVRAAIDATHETPGRAA